MRRIAKDKAYTAMVYATLLSDHRTPATGKTLVITISKAGAAFASISPTVTERGNGWYAVALVAADTDTEGDLALRGVTAAADIDEIAIVAQVEPRHTPGAAAVVSDAGNTATTFKTDLSSAVTDYWKDCYLTFVTGTLAGQTKKVSGYNGSTKFIAVAALTATPTAADKFILING
jgi:hypothetical protein